MTTNRPYPRVSQREMIKRNQPQCQATNCNAAAVWNVKLQLGWFRGDDCEVKCCQAHCTVKSISESGDVWKFMEQFPKELFK